MALYNYRLGYTLDGGAERYAFEPTFSLPLVTLPGPGTPYRMQWKVTQPEQLYYNLAQQMQGINGIVAGQVALSPLLDTSQAGITG